MLGKYRVLLSVLLSLVYCYILFRLESEPPGSTAKLNFEELKPKLILFATPWYRYPHYPYISETSKLCPHCIFTENSSLFESSDAVVFHGVTLSPKPPIGRRHSNQIWVWLIIEPPRHSYYQYLRRTLSYVDMFNWTMTYRRDSDIFVPYGRFISKDEALMPSWNQSWTFIQSESGSDYYGGKLYQVPTINDLKDRKMAAWIVSHCRTGAAREKIAQELGKYISVDMYGDCGKLKCVVPRWNTTKSGLTGVDCRFELSSKYKFYLSFENSPCEDYVTEKFFDTFYTQMVPIVSGSANYSHLAPKNSFINVADFKDLKSLTEYLIYLDKHPKEYLKYFEWRKEFWVQNNGFVSGYCALCDKVWNAEKERKTKSYHNIFDWFIRRSDFETSGKNACDWIQHDLY